MKRLSRMLGVTLLEIMLVLAIAAMVIVMSIRYYQSATVSQQTNGILQQILAITAAADNLSQGTGTYSAATSANISDVVGANNMKTPWSGGASGFTITPATTSITIQANTVPTPVCTALKAKITVGTGSRYTSPDCTGGNFVVTYNMTPTT